MTTNTFRASLIALAPLLLAAFLAGCDRQVPTSQVSQPTAQASVPASAPAQQTTTVSAAPTLPQPLADAVECFTACIGTFRTPETSAGLPLAPEFSELLKNNEQARRNFLELVAKLPEELRPLQGVDLLGNKAKPLKSAMPMAITSNGIKFQVYGMVNYQTNGSDRQPNGYVTKENYLYGGLTALVNAETFGMSIIYSENGFRVVRGDAPVGAAVAFHVAREIYNERKYNEDRRLTTENVLSFPVNSEVLDLAKNRVTQIAAVYKDDTATGLDSFSLKTALPPPDPSKIWFSANRSNSECIQTGGPASKLDDLNGTSAGLRSNDFKDSAGNIVKVEVIKPHAGGAEEVWTYYKSRAQCVTEQVNAGKRLADKYR